MIVLWGSSSVRTRFNRMTVCASTMISRSSCCGVSSLGEKLPKRLMAVAMTCSAAAAPPLYPPAPSARITNAVPRSFLLGMIATRSCCSARSPRCWPVVASMETGIVVGVEARSHTLAEPRAPRSRRGGRGGTFHVRVAGAPEPRMTDFLLLRHGETLWNLAGRLQGWQDSPLSAAGATQAEALAARLAAERVERLVARDRGADRRAARARDDRRSGSARAVLRCPRGQDLGRDPVYLPRGLRSPPRARRKLRHPRRGERRAVPRSGGGLAGAPRAGESGRGGRGGHSRRCPRRRLPPRAC